ncbi:hypothetical protein ACUYVR_001644 [Campylobacter jejuni]|uniref:hypothetical protein n=1 Tax=Campylobacter jejuni TaxID=197 RepID=UPI0002F49105|nr:hypothetical protein [Campylobacter jejuni]EAH5706879.1 hypothetical protein [Campylobacter coli]EAC1394443.1 hypothetical protein [Campylobacter jejuni]EAH4801536.1 hypothetical protein [Campylobacter jejuni]EAH5106056.1 hypothetical protein [Campylobacter jejuni]EAH5273820.1 hypothetical protein [Campylobacter jejuni]
MNNNNIDNLKLYICNESYDYERVMKAFKGEQDLINKIQINQQNPRSINKIQIIQNKNNL